MTHPKIIINLKTYKQTTKNNPTKLAQICQTISKKNKIKIALAPQTTDIQTTKQKNKKTPIYAQHFDTKKQGKNTGYTTIQAIKKAGATGSIINHSEHQIPLKEIQKTIKLAKQHKLNLIICTDNLKNTKKIAKLKPTAIAFEIPELIGGKKSITTTNPKKIKQIIKETKKISKNTLVYCGAGIKTQKDTQKAIQLGIDGILISSGITKSKNPQKTLNQLAQPFNKK